MCGIIGAFNCSGAKGFVKAGLETLRNRGRDGYGMANEKECAYDSSAVSESNNVLGHCLHSLVGFVKQPLVEGNAKFAVNCEIYNWKAICKKHGFDARNDAEALFRLLLKADNMAEALDEVDGKYALALWKGNKVFLARDIIGLKPIWYSAAKGFRFASEKKAVGKEAVQLNPRQVLVYDINSGLMETMQRTFFSIMPEISDEEDKTRDEVIALLQEAVKKRIPGQKFGLLFSGGLDSMMIAMILKRLNSEFTCYTAGADEGADDVRHAKAAAEKLGLKLKTKITGINEVEGYLRKIVPLIEDTNVTKVGVALPFYIACEMAREDGAKVIFSGLGSDELFGGYHRHKGASNLNDECLASIRKIYEKGTYRDDAITMANCLELRLPFLDKKVVEYALRIPGSLKLKDETEKWILRRGAKSIGMPEEFAMRKKKAAQYGSRFDAAIGKLARKSGKKMKSAYLAQFYGEKNLRLAALCSSGKDSLFALYTMMKRNYAIECLVTLKSRNPDSFMFHTPNIGMAVMQAEAMGIPIIVQETEGEREHELADLKIALEKAKQRYSVEGIVTGALFSQYQRERIEKAADEIGLTVFSPLWHNEQEKEMRDILKAGFKFIITKIAADGLDKSWLGRAITSEDICKLSEISKRHGLNVAFEGGEAETLVMDGPIFNKKIVIKEAEIIMENECTGIYQIKLAELEEKP